MTITQMTILKMDRREFLQKTAILPLLLPSSTVLGTDFWNLPRELWLARKNKNGWEQVKTTYWADGALAIDGYREICTILRDIQQDQAVQMDIVLFDVLRGIQGWLEAANIKKPIIINSAYRTLHTNDRTEGAKRNSMHLYGKAADIWIDGISTEYLARLGVYLSGGGVGYYATKGFVHVDTGRLRIWRG